MSHSVTEAIEAIARGEIVIVTDDDDRENEGDLSAPHRFARRKKWPSSSATAAASFARR